MADKPRLKLPKQAKKGEVIQIKTLVQHPMETGLRKDPNGNLIPRKIINKFTCVFNGKPVFSADLEPAIAGLCDDDHVLGPSQPDPRSGHRAT